MEAVLGSAVAELLKMGGGYVLAAVFFILYLYERKDKLKVVESKEKLSAQLFDKLLTLSTKQAEASAQTAAVLRETDKTLDSVSNTLNILVLDNRRKR